MAEDTAPIVVVTGANGFVGTRVCLALLARGASVRGIVRAAGTAPDGVDEHVGDFADLTDAVREADAAVTTVHPMGSDRDTQARIGVDATRTFATGARDAGVGTLIHVSTAAVYDRSPGDHDVDEDAALVGDDADDYAVTKRDADAALAALDGVTRVLVRPPAILGPGATSFWNTRVPAGMRTRAPHPIANATFAWVHIDDLAALIADIATGRIAPPDGACTPVNVAAGPATQRDYYGTVTRALGIDPTWDDAPGWTGRILADRARDWGWAPTVTLDAALSELEAGLSPTR